ncbi:hypothetical protein E2562_010834 [Oryza meyeriana var. granulata]|uniref:Uncharacterized protein n=1 Tax=Oryza meyeriana var. granulata TaxID=110450 RepID=A0A6G1BK07_9ORYZ|nr:hypothetical protein E2562_010834 [Oryza meyeriana var. granulata]
MFYLLAVHPAMLPVGSNVQAEAVEGVKASNSASTSSKERFLLALAVADRRETDSFWLTGKLFQEAKGVLLLQQQEDLGCSSTRLASPEHAWGAAHLRLVAHGAPYVRGLWWRA